MKGIEIIIAIGKGTATLSGEQFDKLLNLVRIGKAPVPHVQAVRMEG